jgi:hypothetical protein
MSVRIEQRQCVRVYAWQQIACVDGKALGGSPFQHGANRANPALGEAEFIEISPDDVARLALRQSQQDGCATG